MGSAADRAIAADAPQIAVAPPDRTPKRGSNPIQRATIIRSADRQRDSCDDQQHGLQPSEATSPSVIFRPSSATPRRSTDLERERDPGIAAVDLAKEVHRNAEQQGEQHDRPAGQAGGKAGGGRDQERRHQSGTDAGQAPCQV